MLPVNELMERWKAACEFQQVSDRNRILAEIERWKNIHNLSLPVRFINDIDPESRIGCENNQYHAEFFARAILRIYDTPGGSATQTALNARRTSTAGFIHHAVVIRPDRTVNAIIDDTIFQFFYDLSLYTLAVIESSRTNDKEMYDRWLPLFNAFEAGLWRIAILESEILLMEIPTIKVDEREKHTLEPDNDVQQVITDIYKKTYNK